MQALRLPAQELERALIGMLTHFLKDRTGLFEILESHGLHDTGALQALLCSASIMAEGLQEEPVPDGA